MKVVFLGPPGAGKGTQAERICEKYAIPHISTGDILRAEIKSASELGTQVQSFIDGGQLVPDTLIVEIVKRRLLSPDCINGYLLDGFPRTVFQADALSEFAPLDGVVNIDVPLDKLANRLTSRRVCTKCGATLNVAQLDGPDAKCTKCGGELMQRDDDKLETVTKRLEVYTAQTAPLIEYYEKKGLLLTIDGNRAIDTVFADIVNALEGMK